MTGGKKPGLGGARLGEARYLKSTRIADSVGTNRIKQHRRGKVIAGVACGESTWPFANKQTIQPLEEVLPVA
jgi:hypothetical protein